MLVVASFYRFFPFPDFADWREPLLRLLSERDIKGTILLAGEGLNGTVCGPRSGVEALLEWLAAADARLASMEYRESLVQPEVSPFLRTRVKLKRELVALGVPGVDPGRGAGTRVPPGDWNALIAEPDLTLIDTRNDYEVAVGSFPGALNPETGCFREFPDFVRRRLDPARRRRVAMFCTGGIRCEKATAYLLQQGFAEVFQLQGGILKYLEEVPEPENLFQGECFVFDNRVSLDVDLAPTACGQCRACRRPLAAADLASPLYEAGVSCPFCHDLRLSGQGRYSSGYQGTR